MPALLLAAAVVGMTAACILGQPRPAHAPPTLVLGGNMPALVQLAPVVAARVTGGR